ncbi:WXG100 family type VII secretion target [Nocardia sp. CDC160]|uniref:WXG100 family type VII secretion target n=1 Tax=Nocardia sp. CDC160 TaxID=3112166 RepID=UPI002DB77CAD|nr:WXG100 family type VII secretion target [Nocardia sp. CDC160]MEC3915046.1 WXG100 family type VII secretion target [Nocardia sp. CDC160]
MAPKVGVTPEQLRGAAGQMADLRDRVHGILDTLEKSLSAKGNAWGGDGYGSTFADGEQGYLAAHRNLAEGIANTATTLGSYAEGQYRAADLLAHTDHRNGTGFRR